MSLKKQIVVLQSKSTYVFQESSVKFKKKNSIANFISNFLNINFELHIDFL